MLLYNIKIESIQVDSRQVKASQTVLTTMSMDLYRAHIIFRILFLSMEKEYFAITF